LFFQLKKVIIPKQKYSYKKLTRVELKKHFQKKKIVRHCIYTGLWH